VATAASLLRWVRTDLHHNDGLGMGNGDWVAAEVSSAHRVWPWVRTSWWAQEAADSTDCVAVRGVVRPSTTRSSDSVRLPTMRASVRLSGPMVAPMTPSRVSRNLILDQAPRVP